MEHPLILFKHCPKCGSARFEINNVKSKRCKDCGFVYYANPSAATAAFIVNEREELLVCIRGKEPAKGTFDLPGGFIDMGETAEEGIKREVKEETGLDVVNATYLFSIPNIYLYSGMEIHTMDLFFSCQVGEYDKIVGMDDVAETRFIPISQLNPADFGLTSISKAISLFIQTYTKKTK